MSHEVRDAESRLIEQWITPTLGNDASVRVGGIVDAGADGGTVVTLTLLDIAPSPAARQASGLVPMQLRARYLVTVTAPESAQALTELGFAAGAISGLELEAAPSPAFWDALGVRTRPALVAAVLLQRARESRSAPRVRQPLVTQWTPSRPLAGVVMGPGDIPIAGALVEVEGGAQSAYSNHRGEFAFRAVPGTDPPPTLVVSAKGTHLRIRVDATGSPDDPVLIRVPLSES